MPDLQISERIKRIQSFLNVDADGIVGAETLSAIENRLIGNDDRLATLYSLTISRTGMEQLIAHEVISKNYYNRHLKHPVWPGGASGLTMGIGYDLGYNRRAQIDKDWRGRVPDADLDTIKNVSGLKADAAKAMLNSLSEIEIDYEQAVSVFCDTTLPRHARLTRQVYDGIDGLFPDAQAALLSLVYNRGVSMSGTRRKEMAAIRPLVLQQDYPAIAQEILNMKRLWAGKGLDGLLNRRDAEAALVLQSGRRYKQSELIRV